jgi:TolA-binding protein
MRRAWILCCALLFGLGFGLGVVPGWLDAVLAMEEADRLWTVGQQAFSDGLYPLSQRTLERLVERYPSDPRVQDAVLLLGKARFSMKAFPLALEAFKRAESFTPPPGRPGEARFWEAETLFRLARYAEARDVYDLVVSGDSTSPFVPDAIYGRAWCDRELKERDLAVADFRRLLSSYPEHETAASATFYLARTLIELRRPAEAEPLLRSFAAKYPAHRLLPAAHYELGQALLAAGDTKGGLAELRAFIAAYPDHELTPQARRLVADTVVRKGGKAELADEYKRLIAQSPPTAESLYDAAALAVRLGRGHDAETAWARVRKEFPDHALASRAALDLGQAAFGRNAFKDAAVFGQAASKSGEGAVRAEGLLLLGESELRLKRHAAALAAFQSTVEVPKVEPALRFRALAGSGLALEEQQKWAQAARYYDEVAAKSPDKTLRAWAKERRTAISAKLNPASDANPKPAAEAAPKPGADGKVAPKASATGKSQPPPQASGR